MTTTNQASQSQNTQTTSSISNRTRANLVLDNGATFPGFLFGAAPAADIAGEVTFTTDMFGYEQQMCVPEHSGQILVFATPEIGNVGWTGQGAGEGKTDITVSAVIIRDLSRIASNHEAKRSLEEEMTAQNVTGLWGVDTRMLIRAIADATRKGETVRGQIIAEKQEA